MSLIEVVGTSFKMNVEIVNSLQKSGLARTEMQLSAGMQKKHLYLLFLSLLALWLEEVMPRPSQPCTGCQSWCHLPDPQNHAPFLFTLSNALRLSCTHSNTSSLTHLVTLAAQRNQEQLHVKSDSHLTAKLLV